MLHLFNFVFGVVWSWLVSVCHVFVFICCLFVFIYLVFSIYVSVLFYLFFIIIMYFYLFPGLNFNFGGKKCKSLFFSSRTFSGLFDYTHFIINRFPLAICNILYLFSFTGHWHKLKHFLPLLFYFLTTHLAYSLLLRVLSCLAFFGVPCSHFVHYPSVVSPEFSHYLICSLS